MPLNGDLETMPLAELLQWAGGNQKTGVLELERNKIRRRISFRDGRIVACCSNDPASLLGHFLISRGQISERTLRYALKQKRDSDARMSDVLIDMGVLSEGEVREAIRASAEETIYALFEWRTAAFRFDARATLEHSVEVDLSVEHTLLNGAHRQDELDRIRGVFPGSGVVLRCTDRALPANLGDGALTFQLLGLVDGQRNLAELLLMAHASEYQALKVLFGLRESGHVEIAEVRPPAKGAATLLDLRETEPTELPSLAEVIDATGGTVGGGGTSKDDLAPDGRGRETRDGPAAIDEATLQKETSQRSTEQAVAPGVTAAGPTSKGAQAPTDAETDGTADDETEGGADGARRSGRSSPASGGRPFGDGNAKGSTTVAASDDAETADPDPDAPAELVFLIQLAADKLDRGDPQGALATLDGCYRARPHDESVRSLMERAEASYLESVRKFLLAPHRVPARTDPAGESLPSDLTPAESMLLGMIDGENDIESIVWVARMREVEVFRTLEKLHDRGLIVVGSSTGARAASSAPRPAGATG